MAQADFDFVVQSGGTPSLPPGGSDGDAVLNSSLATPLSAGYGSYSREYAFPNTSFANATSILGLISSSVDSGSWVGTPITHAISVRAALRVGTAGPDYKSVGISVKTGVMVGQRASGYHLVLGQLGSEPNPTGDDSELTLVLNSVSSFPVTSRSVTISSGLPTDKWYVARMDVIPNGDGQDIIKIYTSPTTDFGSETWTLAHTELVMSTDQHYADWGDSSSNKIGFYLHVPNTFGYQPFCYIDGFVAYREEV